MAEQVFFLSNSAVVLQGRIGTEFISSSEDDSYRAIDLGFGFKLFGATYDRLYPGSNTYITANSGSGIYYNLSLGGNPPFPGIHLGSSDNSWQRAWSYFGPDSSPDYWRIRYEGTASTWGTADNPNIVYEATYFNPALTGNKQYIEIVFGVHNRPSGIFGITTGSSSSENVSGGTVNDYMSYVFESDLEGRNWRILEGFSISSSSTITQANAAPVLADAGSALAYTEGDGASVVDSSLSLSDVDDTNIESAIISISSGFQTSEDLLSFTNTNGITGSWNASTGILTLSGSATKAQYEQALESITYTNTNTNNPITTSRAITWIVNDGSLDSAAVTSTISVVGVNDAPSAANATAAVGEDETYIFSAPTFGFSDVDTNDSLKSIIITGYPQAGELRFDGQTINSSNGEYEVLAGDIGKLTFTPNNNGNGQGYAVLTFKVTDQDNAKSETATITIDVTPQNDAPIIRNIGTELEGAVKEKGHKFNDGTPVVGTSLITGQLSADNVDQPNGDVLSWSIVGKHTDDYGEFRIDSVSGKWEYILDNSKTAVQALFTGDRRETSFIARVTDVEGLYADQTINIDISGTDDIISQYADHVIGASSTRQANSGDRWSAIQALGAPNQDTAWSPSRKNSSGQEQANEYLALGFKRPVKATGFIIYENFSSGFVTRVEAIDLEGNAHQLWEGEDNSGSNSSKLSVALDEPTNYIVKGLRVWIDINPNRGWEGIDAIELTGWAVAETYKPLPPTLDMVAGNDVVNAAEKAAGITLTGQAEPNGTVEISWGGLVHTARVGPNHDWSVLIKTSDIPSDSTNSAISIISVDADGYRSTPNTRSVRINTSSPAIPEIYAISTDNKINREEKAKGIAVEGRAQGSVKVHLNWGNNSLVTDVNNDGLWSVLLGGQKGIGLLPDDSASSSLSIIGIDGDGNKSETSTANIAIDTLAPTAPLLSAATGENVINALEKLGGITLNGQAEAGSRVHLEWEGKAYVGVADSTGNWSVDLASSDIPSDNPFSRIRLQAVDSAGNASDYSKHEVVIDTTAPGKPVILPLKKNGILNLADIGKPLTISGTAEPLSWVEVLLANSSFKTKTSSKGRWDIGVSLKDLPTDISDLTITATVSDVAGNRSQTTSESVTIDRVAPGVPIINTPGEQGTINHALRSAGFVISGQADAGSMISLQWQQLKKLVEVGNNGDWSIPILSTDVLQDGISDIVVQASDQAGNTSQIQSHKVLVDTTPPKAPRLLGKISSDGILTAAERQDGLLISGTSLESESVDVTLDGLTKRVDSRNGTWQVVFNTAEIAVAEDEKKIVRFVARDKNGNISEQTTSEVVLRTTPPRAPEIDASVPNKINATAKSAGIVLSGKTETAVDRVELSWSNRTALVPVKSGAWSLKVRPSEIPQDGTTVLRLVSLTNGVRSAPRSYTIEIDSIAPDAPVANPIGSNRTVNKALKDTGISITGRSEPSALIKLTWGQFKSQVTADSDGYWLAEVPPSDIPSDGTSELSVTASDGHGNTSIATRQRIRIDSISPSNPSLDLVAQDDVISAVEMNEGVTLTGSSEAGASVGISVGDIRRNVVASKNGRWVLKLSSNELPPSGLSTDVVVVATDEAGNSSTETRRQIQLAYIAEPIPVLDIVASDDIINEEEGRLVKFSGKSEAGSLISLVLGSSKFTGYADNYGAWEIVMKANQLPSSDGVYPIGVTAINRSGIPSGVASKSVSIDRTAPSLTSATVDGNLVKLTFSEALRPSQINASQFSVKGGRETLSVQQVGVVEAIQSELVLRLGTTPLAGTELFISYKPNAQYTRVSDQAGNLQGRINNFSPQVFKTATSVTSLAESYRELVLSGDNPISARGNNSDNTIIGNNAMNIITGGNGADVLTGLGGSDRFILTDLRESLLGTESNPRFDRITDLAIGSDIIDGPSAVARGQVSVMSSINTLGPLALGQLLTSAQFKANGAAIFSLQAASSQRWFIALNDNIAGFDANRDAVIEITGFTGQIVDLEIS